MMSLKKLLPFFSYLFHPLFIPLYATVSFFFMDDTYLSTVEKFLLIIQVIIVTVLIPGAFFFFLRSLGKVNSIMASEAKERVLPLFIQVILVAILISRDSIFERIPELFFFYLGTMISTLTAMVHALFNVKISLHLMGLGAFTFFTIELSYFNQINAISFIAILLFITGLVASSRLYMKAHSNKELAFGFLAGVLPQMILWTFWL